MLRAWLGLAPCCCMCRAACRLNQQTKQEAGASGTARQAGRRSNCCGQHLCLPSCPPACLPSCLCPQESSAALELDPRYTKVLLRRSTAYETLDDLERALADAEKVGAGAGRVAGHGLGMG